MSPFIFLLLYKTITTRHISVNESRYNLLGRDFDWHAMDDTVIDFVGQVHVSFVGDESVAVVREYTTRNGLEMRNLLFLLRCELVKRRDVVDRDYLEVILDNWSLIYTQVGQFPQMD